MIRGIGTDLVSRQRIEKILERFGQRFVQRILTPKEQEQYAKLKNGTAFLARRYAAKEAIAKALGTGIAKGVGFQNIEITNKPSGEPQVHLMGGALEILEKKGAFHVHLSISDEKSYAVAFVVISS